MFMTENYVEALINKGTILCHLGKYSEAKDPFVRAANCNRFHTAKTVRRLGKPGLKKVGIDEDCRPL